MPCTGPPQQANGAQASTFSGPSPPPSGPQARARDVDARAPPDARTPPPERFVLHNVVTGQYFGGRRNTAEYKVFLRCPRRRLARLLAADPKVAMFEDQAAGVETQQRHACQILGAAIDERGVCPPGNRGLIAVDDRAAKLAFGRLFLRKHAAEVARLRLAERMLLPERTIGVERGDGVRVVLTPAALPNVCPPLRRLSSVHGESLKNQTRTRAARP